MIHCTNLKSFPQYLKCPRVNHSITSDENSPRPPFKRPGLPLSYLKCLQMGGGQGHSWKMFKRKQLFPPYDFP